LILDELVGASVEAGVREAKRKELKSGKLDV
jgi:hypothetical protein